MSGILLQLGCGTLLRAWLRICQLWKTPCGAQAPILGTGVPARWEGTYMIARAARRFRTCGLVGSGMRGEYTAVSDRVASVRASGRASPALAGPQDVRLVD